MSGRFLVELYLPKGAAGEVDSATSRAQAAAAADGAACVRCLRSIFVPEEETWFLLYEGPTLAAVREAVQRAELDSAHIMEAVAPS